MPSPLLSSEVVAFTVMYFFCFDEVNLNKQIVTIILQTLMNHTIHYDSDSDVLEVCIYINNPQCD